MEIKGKRNTEPTKRLPQNVFFEKNALCSWIKRDLEVDTIHSRIDNLKKYDT